MGKEMKLTPSYLINADTFSTEERRENGRKGAQQAHIAKKRNAKIREMLNDMLEQPAASSERFKALCERYDIGTNKTIKEVYTTIALLRSAERANLQELETLVRLLGEDNINEQDNGVLNNLLVYIYDRQRETENAE